VVCQKCEVTPPPISGGKSYYIWPPIGHSGMKIRKILTDSGTSFSADSLTGALRLEAEAETFKRLCIALTGTLSSEERRTTIVLVKEIGTPPTAADIPDARSFEAVSNFIDAGWLLGLVNEDRLQVSLSPVVHAEEWGDVFALSAGIYGIDNAGNKIGSRQIYSTAADAHILAPVDRAARLTAINTTGQSGRSVPTFIPFSPSSIYDPEFCLRSTVAAVKEAGIDAGLIIFTVMMTENLPDRDHLRGILRYYRDAGFQVAMDEIGAGAASLDLLSQIKPDLIRISPTVATGVADDSYKSVVVRKLLEMAQRLRIDTVAGGVANESDATFLYEHGANYLEGSFITASAPSDADIGKLP
jgi:EAL domain-containing protein (putative c-di-GMP-specific phosphodiesterase class I)